MISYLVTRAGSHTIAPYLESRGRALASAIDVVFYDDLGDRQRVSPGTTVFTALDQISPLQRAAAGRIRNQLVALGQRALNHPTKSLLRYELLKTLRRTGWNAFDVHRATDFDAVTRFPVFVRDEHLHNGNLTPLLHNQDELRRAIQSLMLRGRRPADLLVVEFCDTADGFGRIRKYAAFRVGDAIIPRYVQVSSSWMIKLDTSDMNAEALEEERDYVTRNPHGAWLLEVFRLAGIDYGRIDYGMLDGRPQVWEINTNPTVTLDSRKGEKAEYPRFADRIESLRQMFYERFAAELRALDAPADGPEIILDLDAAMRRGLRADARRRRRRKRLATRITRFIESAWVQRAKPYARRVLLPVAELMRRTSRRS